MCCYIALCGFPLLRVEKHLCQALSANTSLGAPRDDQVKLLHLILGETSPLISVIMESVVKLRSFELAPSRQTSTQTIVELSNEILQPQKASVEANDIRQCMFHSQFKIAPKLSDSNYGEKYALEAKIYLLKLCKSATVYLTSKEAAGIPPLGVFLSTIQAIVSMELQYEFKVDYECRH